LDDIFIRVLRDGDKRVRVWVRDVVFDFNWDYIEEAFGFEQVFRVFDVRDVDIGDGSGGDVERIRGREGAAAVV